MVDLGDISLTKAMAESPARYKKMESERTNETDVKRNRDEGNSERKRRKDIKIGKFRELQMVVINAKNPPPGIKLSNVALVLCQFVVFLFSLQQYLS